MDQEAELRRAAEARSLLDNPLFVEARKHIEDQLAQARRTVPMGADAMHTRLILMGQLTDKFFGYFEMLAQSGKMAELDLQQKRTWAEEMRKRYEMFKTLGRNAI